MRDSEQKPGGSAGPSPTPRSLMSRWPLSMIIALIRWTFWGVGLVASGAVVGLLAIGIALAVAYPNLPDVTGLSDYRPKLPLRIYSADGVLIGEFGEERRDFTPVMEIPKYMRAAVLAIEDSRFYEHGGVDYKGIARAAVAQFGGVGRQGASTITMQVARNFYLSSEKTFTRKIYEVLLALKIEALLSKNQILEVYMNQIYLGQRAYGFTTAAEIYFGKSLNELSIAEAAMLAGLPKAPSAYNPISNPKRATRRQQYIIDRMLENGFITPEQHAQAKTEVLRYRNQSEVAVHSEYVAEAARQLVFNQYGQDAYSRGLNVFVSVKSREQMAAYRALRKGVMDYERRQVYRGPEDYVELDGNTSDLDARIAEALVDHPDNDELKAAVVLEASPRKVVAVLQTGESVTVQGDGLKPATSGLASTASAKVRVRRGSIIRLIRSSSGEWSITQMPEVEGALIALDPNTGAVRAMVGGFDYSRNKFNRVTQAWRQPGSSFKPFIYSSSLEKGFTPTTVINDSPLFFGADVTGSQPWEPKNYDGKFEGPMTMRTALAKSKNMVSIRILQSVGVGYAQQWLTRFGFETSKHPGYLTMALGAGSVTPMQMATGYSVFANGGYLLDPVLIQKVTDTKGRVIAEVKPVVLDESLRTLEARNAFVMDSLLQEVTRSGTAARAQSTLKRPDLSGKTGTTNDSMDAWFAGYQHNAVAVVWMGYDNPRKLGDRETGGGLSLPIWIDYMSEVLKDVPVWQPTPPEGVVNSDGDWYYSEYAMGSGVSSVGVGDKTPNTPSEDERKSILDLFSR